ncbi:hypothetical protein G6F53_013217 [Rhizopus delemar]|nr:hypothetical protein G6F53_013217 [Rhizopus delemar]
MYQQSPVSATNLATSLNQKINDGLNDLWQRQEAVRSTISYPMSHDSKLFRKIDNISVNKFARLFVVLNTRVRILPSLHQPFHARSHDFPNVRRLWLSVCAACVLRRVSAGYLVHLPSLSVSPLAFCSVLSFLPGF